MEAKLRRPQRPQILLVENSDIDIILFLKHAAEYKIDDIIEVTRSAEQALAYLKDQYTSRTSYPVIIVTDLYMHGMNGHQFIDSIRAHPSFSNFVIFVVSSSDEQRDIDEAYAKKIAGFIRKDKKGEMAQKCAKLLKAYCDAVSF